MIRVRIESMKSIIGGRWPMNIWIMVFPHETKGTIALDQASAASNEAFSTSTVES